MYAIDTFLTILYDQVDCFCKDKGIHHPRRGRKPNLSCAEVVTLALFSQWGRFQSERDFYRFADQKLRLLFPRLPHRSQLNRAIRQHQPLLMAFFRHLVGLLKATEWSYEILDGTAIAVRNAQRRGEGWLPEYVAIGKGSRLGWYEGFHLLLASNPKGEITGFGFGSANTKDQPLAEALLWGRAQRCPQMPSVGGAAQGSYVTDTGFEGADNHQRWRALYGAEVICPPRPDYKQQWTKAKRRVHTARRQVIESIFDRLLFRFRLSRERPHLLGGFWARLTASVALHNFCIWLNRSCGRPRLAFADLLGW
jgi:hypothetical protein